MPDSRFDPADPVEVFFSACKELEKSFQPVNVTLHIKFEYNGRLCQTHITSVNPGWLLQLEGILLQLAAHYGLQITFDTTVQSKR